MIPTSAAFDRAERAWLEPPDDVWLVCTCRHEESDHNGLPDDTGCTVCGDCDGFTVIEPCDDCNGYPCVCDRLYDEYRDRIEVGR